VFLIIAVAMALTATGAGADPVPEALPPVSLPAYGSQQSALAGAGSCSSSDSTTVARAIASPRQLRVLCLGHASLETVTVFARSNPTAAIATQAVSCSGPAGYWRELFPGVAALVTVTQSLTHSCTTTDPAVMVCSVTKPHRFAVYCLSGRQPNGSISSASTSYARFDGDSPPWTSPVTIRACRPDQADQVTRRRTFA